MVGSIRSSSRRSQPRRNLMGAATLPSASAVGRIAIGRDQERHMMMGSWIRHAEADDHFIEKAGVGKGDTLSGKIVAGVEDQLIRARGEGRALQQRPFAASVGVRGRRCDALAPRSHAIKLDRYSCPRTAM